MNTRIIKFSVTLFGIHKVGVISFLDYSIFICSYIYIYIYLYTQTRVFFPSLQQQATGTRLLLPTGARHIRTWPAKCMEDTTWPVDTLQQQPVLHPTWTAPTAALCMPPLRLHTPCHRYASVVIVSCLIWLMLLSAVHFFYFI